MVKKRKITKCKVCKQTLLDCGELGWIHPEYSCTEDDGIVMSETARIVWNKEYPYKSQLDYIRQLEKQNNKLNDLWQGTLDFRINYWITEQKDKLNKIFKRKKK